MTRKLFPLAFVVAAIAAQTTAANAQATPDIPGGATGSTVYCLQAGDLNSGAFVGSYLQTANGTWEERLKAGSFKMTERKRDDLTVELYDDKRGAAVQFDFVNRTVKYKPSSPASASWRDRYYILNATDKAGSSDCAQLANLSEPAEPPPGAGANTPGAGGAPGGGGGPGASGGGNRGGGGGGGGGGGRGGPGRYGPPPNPVIMVVVPPKSPVNIPPGTKLTALAGPPCPGHPDMFLCPNKFSCAPIGGVCCPGAGACGRGAFCDHFIAGNCIRPGEPRFCAGSANLQVGEAAHCAPGLTCGPNGCRETDAMTAQRSGG
jgi:hypothetical protein